MIFSCGYGESFNTSDAKYFLKHPHLKWVTTDITNAYRLPGVIPVINPMGTFYVGRMQKRQLDFTNRSEEFSTEGWGTWDPLPISKVLPQVKSQVMLMF